MFYIYILCHDGIHFFADISLKQIVQEILIKLQYLHNDLFGL